MSWSGPYDVQQVAPTFRGLQVLHVIGKKDDRGCGCSIMLGMRLDVFETTLELAPCAAHERECERALEAWKGMEPSDREVFELMEELLDRQLDALGSPL